MQMNKLDLHGILHEDVYDEVENFVFLNARELPVSIITGASTRMKEIVTDVLEANNFEFHTPTYNAGEIIVTQDKDY